MVKGKRPFISLLASGRFGRYIRVVKRQHRQVIQVSPDPPDVKSLAQLSWRHMYQKAVALWHALSAAEKISWEGAGTVRHMTGFAWFMSQCLKPNPGLYLPLQGGTMTGEIIMGGEGVTDLPDPSDPQDADTLAAREAAIAAALADCIDSHIHGWDGANWQKLLTESNTLHNLRVRLYDGANAISTHLWSGAQPDPGNRGMMVNAFLYGNDRYPAEAERTDVDNIAPSAITKHLCSVSYLLGFDGVNWDRLRTYATGVLKVGRAEVGLQTPRLVGVGQVKASPGKLYWLLLNPSAGNSTVEFTNDLDGLGAVVLDHFDTAREGHPINFDPPMEFTTGIYLKTFTNMTSVIVGYL